MTWRRWLLCVLLVGLLGVTELPASAAGETITLSGSRTASVDVTFAEDTTFDLAKLTSTGAGRFAGFYAEALGVAPAQRLDGNRHAGAVMFRDVHEPGAAGYVFSFVATLPSTLKAGRYRLYLLADGPTRVRVPVSGIGSLRLVPSRPAVAAVASDPDILTSAVEARNVQPLAITCDRTISMSALLVGGFRAYAGQIGTCLRRPESECGTATTSGVDGPFTGVGIDPVEDYGMAWRVSYQPGSLTPGRYEAYQGAVNVGGLRYASAAAFSLTLT